MTGVLPKLAGGIGLLLASTFAASAMPTVKFESSARTSAETVVPVAQGCGPGAWRGPWGGCRDTPYSGTLPGGGWAPPPPYQYFGNGCPPGYWRGPWGHCRNTPYHGRLPNGGWQ